jgi:hypothetical protein
MNMSLAYASLTTGVLGLAVLVALQSRHIRLLAEAVRSLTRSQCTMTAEWSRHRCPLEPLPAPEPSPPGGHHG